MYPTFTELSTTEAAEKPTFSRNEFSKNVMPKETKTEKPRKEANPLRKDKKKDLFKSQRDRSKSPMGGEEDDDPHNYPATGRRKFNKFTDLK